MKNKTIERDEIINSLRETFKLVVESDINPESINEESNIMNDLGINSVGLIYLIIGIEKTFNIDMREVTFNTFKVVGDVVDYIYKKVNNK